MCTLDPAITLEPQTADHAVELYPLLADPALYTYIDRPPPDNLEAFTNRLRRLESRRLPDGSRCAELAVRLRMVSLRVTSRPPSIRMRQPTRYVLGSRFHRRGIATVACRQMLERLRVECHVAQLLCHGRSPQPGFNRAIEQIGFLRGAPPPPLPGLARRRALLPGDGMSTTLQIEHTGKVATIWLNRPELHNALNEAPIAEPTEAVCQLNRDEAVRHRAGLPRQELHAEGGLTGCVAPRPTAKPKPGRRAKTGHHAQSHLPQCQTGNRPHPRRSDGRMVRVSQRCATSPSPPMPNSP